jgi:acylphosphatase
MAEAQLKIQGKVQGVFFRADAAEKARQLAITGWIKNEDDGTVTCIAQGEKPNIEQFIEWCYQGPSMASVQSVLVKWNDKPDTPHYDFSIYLI